MKTKEIWRLIPSLEGAMASSHGRVMLIPFHSDNERAGRKQWGGIATPGQWDGSRFVWRCNGKNFKVARLVCEAFNGPAPASKPVCMHADENSRNNRPENLEWETQKQNLNAPMFLEYCKSRTGANNPYLKGKARRSA